METQSIDGGQLLSSVKKRLSRSASGFSRRISARLADALQQRIVFVGDRRIDLSGRDSLKPGLIAIVGCEHYRHRSQSYPIRSRAELQQVLELEFGSGRSLRRFIGPWRAEARRVDIYEFAIDPADSRLNAVFLIPETLLLSRYTPDDTILKVERGGQSYFLTSSGLWQRAAGLVSDERVFALAAGEPVERVEGIDQRSILAAFSQALRKLSPIEWLDALNVELMLRLLRTIRPAVVAVGAVGFSYALGISLYLFSAAALRQSQLDALGADVEQLISAQRRLDTLDARGVEISATLAAANRSWQTWQVPATVWANGGRVAAFTLFDGKIMIRGEAPNATAVLGKLAVLDSVADPTFASPVRQDRDSQQFVIEMMRADKHHAR